MSSPNELNAPKYVNNNMITEATRPHIPKFKKANTIIIKLINVIKENL